MRPTAARTALALILALMLLPLLVLVQPALAASAASAPAALTAADITFSSPCGARGTGRQYIAANGREQGEIHTREGEPGKHVGPPPDGYWSTCTMPKPPKPPRNCGAEQAPLTWTVDGHTCTVATHRRALQHGQYDFKLLQMGPMRGDVIERCDDGQRVQRGASCRPATHCDTKVTVTRNGVVYVYDGRRPGSGLPIGSSTEALSPDGRRWPVSCVKGSWVAPNVLPRAP